MAADCYATSTLRNTATTGKAPHQNFVNCGTTAPKARSAVRRGAWRRTTSLRRADIAPRAVCAALRRRALTGVGPHGGSHRLMTTPPKSLGRPHNCGLASWDIGKSEVSNSMRS